MNIKSLIRLWNHTQQHVGTSGARVCAAVLLGLYNGVRFPMDLTDLRLLDGKLLAAALDVIGADSRHCVQEVHVWLNYLSRHSDFGDRFEVLAWEYDCFKRGRARKDSLSPAHVRFGPNGRMRVDRLVIDYPIDIEEQMVLPSTTEVRNALDIEAYQRVMSTPFFNELAG